MFGQICVNDDFFYVNDSVVQQVNSVKFNSHYLCVRVLQAWILVKQLFLICLQMSNRFENGLCLQSLLF